MIPKIPSQVFGEISVIICGWFGSLLLNHRTGYCPDKCKDASASSNGENRAFKSVLNMYSPTLETPLRRNLEAKHRHCVTFSVLRTFHSFTGQLNIISCPRECPVRRNVTRHNENSNNSVRGGREFLKISQN